MDIEQARTILGDAIVQPDEAEDGLPPWSLQNVAGGEYLQWDADTYHATLDGTFTADQLEAIAVWMRAHAK